MPVRALFDLKFLWQNNTAHPEPDFSCKTLIHNLRSRGRHKILR
jgi:hypothetical protein